MIVISEKPFWPLKFINTVNFLQLWSKTVDKIKEFFKLLYICYQFFEKVRNRRSVSIPWVKLIIWICCSKNYLVAETFQDCLAFLLCTMGKEKFDWIFNNNIRVHLHITNKMWRQITHIKNVCTKYIWEIVNVSCLKISFSFALSENCQCQY